MKRLKLQELRSNQLLIETPLLIKCNPIQIIQANKTILLGIFLMFLIEEKETELT